VRSGGCVCLLGMHALLVGFCACLVHKHLHNTTAAAAAAAVCVQSTALLGSGMRFIFIENICNDPEILQQNYLNKMMYSPDYKGISTEKVSEIHAVCLQASCVGACLAMAHGQTQTVVTWVLSAFL